MQETILFYFIKGKVFAKNHEFSDKINHFPAWRNFKINFPRPIFTIIFKPITNLPFWGWNDVWTNHILHLNINNVHNAHFLRRYGNHFGEMEHQVGCMLLPKLTSINCAHFDFPACVFTERNMYLKDRHTGCGREGSGRVAAFKATGLLYSYTLEGMK